LRLWPGARITVGVAAALAALWLLSEYLRGRISPLDFETYYYAAKAAGQNLNPYDLKNLAALAGHKVTLPFVYPPITLLVFAPFTLLSVSVADWAWRCLLLVLLGLLAWIWRARFLPRTNVVLISIALAFGFFAAIWGFKMGNVVILESVLLWAGFASYVDDRRSIFTGLVTLASVFKIIPIIFLTLLLVPSKERPAKPRLALYGLLALMAVVLLSMYLGPSWAREYRPPSIRPTGVVNPSALGLFDTIFGPGSDEPAGLGQQLNPALALWVIYATGIASLGYLALCRSWKKLDSLTLILESTYLYVLISPRPMIYSYIMVIPPMLAFGGPLFSQVGGSVAVLALLIAPAVGRRFGLVDQGMFWNYYPFLVTLVVWLMHAWSLGRAPGHGAQGKPRPAKAGPHLRRT
jgi:hypothetical protein